MLWLSMMDFVLKNKVKERKLEYFQVFLPFCSCFVFFGKLDVMQIYEL